MQKSQRMNRMRSQSRDVTYNISTFIVGNIYCNWYYADINCWMRCGSSPSQSGFWAVLSKIDEVLKGSNSPRDAASAVFAKSDVYDGLCLRTCSSFIGWNVCTASKACSRISMLSIPAITTDVGRFKA